MDIIAVSYHNIGPFQDRRISLHFHQSRVLIHGSIGTGKSFLFFDGILYGLYRSKDARKILNLKSKHGYIKLCIEVDDIVYLITRQLKSSKSNSCVSALYQIDVPASTILDSLIQHMGTHTLTQDTDIEPILKQFPIQLINFKNETDIQQHIQQLVGPIEVLQYSNFLVQDSANIFTQTKSERINILKQIFQLIAIDHAKDILAEHRHKLNTLKTIKSDYSLLESKYHDLTNQLDQTYQHLIDKKSLGSLESLIARMQSVDIDHISRSQQINEQVDQKIEILNQDKQSYQSLQQQYESLHHQHNDIQKKLDLHQQSLQDLKEKKNSLTHMISKTTVEHTLLNQLIQEAQSYLEHMNTIHKTINLEHLQSWDSQVQTLAQADRVIADLLHQGSHGAQEIKHLQNMIDGYVQQSNQGKQQIDILHKKLYIDPQDPQIVKLLDQVRHNFKQEIVLCDQAAQHHQEQIIQLKSQINDLQEQITKLQTVLQNKSEFFCTLIDGSCPFIQTINKSSLQPLELQITTLGQQLQDKVKMLKTLESTDRFDYLDRKHNAEHNLLDIDQYPEKYLQDYIDQIKKQIGELQEQYTQASYDTHIKGYRQKIIQLENQNSRIRDILLQSDYKMIQSSYQHYQTYQKSYEDTQIQIQSLQAQQLQIQHLHGQIQDLDTQILITESKTCDYQGQLESYQHSMQDLTNHMQNNQIDNIHNDLKHIQHIKILVDRLSQLLTDYKSNQSELIQLKNELESINTLYQIFSKDLFLIVLQEILPLVVEILNHLLNTVVTYELMLDIVMTQNEKIELEANVVDEHGIRSVDSLSGGQKTILKLVWILAVSSYLNVKFIFLDETINNLDADTVAKVAQLLEDYLKKHQIKLHVITHSSQIQKMNIWDEVIDLSLQKF